MAPYFTTADIVAATRGALIQGESGAAFGGVSTDSRTCQGGDLFIPLKGERHDGHIYIPKALERGVGGVLVEEKWLSESKLPLVRIVRVLLPIGLFDEGHRIIRSADFCADFLTLFRFPTNYG